MLQHTWKPRNAFLDGTSVITLESLTGKSVTMPSAPVVTNGSITITAPSEGPYIVRVKTKGTDYAYRVNVNDPDNDVSGNSVFNPPVIGPDDPIPANTPPNTIIFRRVA